jgi:DNA-directed RNA polymerases I, II, and III subunit RPABC3
MEKFLKEVKFKWKYKQKNLNVKFFCCFIVSRILGTTETLGMNLVLDINCELFPLSKGQKVNFILTKSIKSDGSVTSSTSASYNPNEGPSLADKFEYVCYGQVYKLEEIPGGKM